MTPRRGPAFEVGRRPLLAARTMQRKTLQSLQNSVDSGAPIERF